MQLLQPTRIRGAGSQLGTGVVKAPTALTRQAPCQGWDGVPLNRCPFQEPCRSSLDTLQGIPQTTRQIWRSADLEAESFTREAALLP